MAHCGALGGPLVGGRIGVAEVDEAQHFVDVSGHVFLSHRHRALAGVLAAHAGRQHGQRLGSDGLAQAKVLVETDTERLVVAPYVEVVRAMLHRADGAVPVIHVVQAQSVGDAAAREAHEARVQVGQRLDQIRAEMLEALIGGSRFEADEVKVPGSGKVRRRAPWVAMISALGCGAACALAIVSSARSWVHSPQALEAGAVTTVAASGLPSSPISATCTGSALPWARVQMEKS